MCFCSDTVLKTFEKVFLDLKIQYMSDADGIKHVATVT